MAASEMCNSSVNYSEKDDRTFAKAIAIQRHNSFAVEAKRSVGKKFNRQSMLNKKNSYESDNFLSVDQKSSKFSQSSESGETIW